ncbi:MAG: helix-turn-helix domain-containing protein [Actinomycetota bacterium]|nr:helix-turn-helix domain-containing protein [Actinomycetota bacterium]
MYVAAPQHLKVFVRRLRTKLGDDAEDPRYIYTIRGIGYRFITRS